MKKYEISEECGGSEVVEAEDMDDAIEYCKEWVQDGDYGDKSCYVSSWVQELAADGEYVGEPEFVEVMVDRAPDVPACLEGYTHDWESPEWLGGCSENPGVWSKGGSQISSVCVCSHCGMYQAYISESTPGQYPKTPEIYSYREADRASMEYVAGMTRDEAVEWVYNQNEDDEIDEGELNNAYMAIFGRLPDFDEDKGTKWSHCCAATPGCGTRPE